MRIEMLDSLINEVASRSNLSTEKVRQLIGVLIALIFDEKRGGFSGFARAFREKGLGHLMQSWIGTGPNQPINAAQIETVFGTPMIYGIASRLGASARTTAGTIGDLLPDLIDGLSEDGKEPTSLPETLKSWVAGVADYLGDLGRLGWGALTAGVAAVGDTVAGGARAVGDAADATVNATAHAVKKAGRGLGALLPWLLLAAVVIVALLWFANRREASPAPTTAPSVQTQPYVDFENANGTALVSGQLASDREKAKLLKALDTVFGHGKVNHTIAVAGNTTATVWLDKLIGVLPDLKTPGVKFRVDGDKVNIDTSALPQTERFALSQKWRTAFEGFEISGLWDKALAAIAALKRGFSADDLVGALNYSVIRFDTGSAAITRASHETLAKAAQAIKAAPPGTRIEVAGHADNTGDAAANQQLSLERADAVVAKLAALGVARDRLVGKGYGESQPIVDNASDEGMAKNRRIEFKVLK